MKTTKRRTALIAKWNDKLEERPGVVLVLWTKPKCFNSNSIAIFNKTMLRIPKSNIDRIDDDNTMKQHANVSTKSSNIAFYFRIKKTLR